MEGAEETRSREVVEANPLMVRRNQRELDNKLVGVMESNPPTDVGRRGNEHMVIAMMP